MELQELLALAATIAGGTVTITESIKGRIENSFNQLSDEQKNNVNFCIAMVVSIVSPFVLSQTSIVDFEVLKSLNNIDLGLLGVTVGMVTTGAYKGIKSMFKSKNNEVIEDEEIIEVEDDNLKKELGAD